MFKLKIRKLGNSLGVTLPKNVITRLRTGEGQRIYLIETGECDYRLIPCDPAFEKKMTKAGEIMERYRKALDTLAR